MRIALLGVFLWGCGSEEKLNYRCTCVQIAYEANDDGSDIDNTFSETICETETVMESTFKPGGDIYTAVEDCRAGLEALSDDVECDCTCEYLGPCS